MTTQLELPSELEIALRQRAAAVGQNVESFLWQVVDDAVDQEKSPPVQPRRVHDLRQRLEAWAARHPVVDRPVDDSRESIYEGRGE
ncbi:MAG: hypothetical protein ACK5Q5_11255 [Planctomycetaceae bacterium]